MSKIINCKCCGEHAKTSKYGLQIWCHGCNTDSYTLGYCYDCGKPIDGADDFIPRFEDRGIGSYEYWGAPGVDVNICMVDADSYCCLASIVDVDGEVVDIDSLPVPILN